MTKTRTIAGHALTLETGKRYLASRPIATKYRKAYPVTIREHIGFDPLNLNAAKVEGLTYEEANELLNAFNNGESSFDGRVW